MKLPREYKKIRLGLEISVRDKFHDLIKGIEDPYQDPSDNMGRLYLAFETLGRSRPGTNDRARWTKDLIKGYEVLGEIFMMLNDEQEPSSNLDDLYEKYEELLSGFEGSNGEEELNNALEYLKKIRGLLEENSLDNFDNLKEKLDELNEEGYVDLDKLYQDHYLLRDFNSGEPNRETLKVVLDYFGRVNDALKANGIKDLNDLSARLSEKDKLESANEENERLKERVGELEEELSTF